MLKKPDAKFLFEPKLSIILMAGKLRNCFLKKYRPELEEDNMGHRMYRLSKRWVVWSLAVMSCLLFFPGTSFAWIYPEHRDITALAVQKLDPERRAILDRLWAGARSGHEGRVGG